MMSSGKSASGEDKPPRRAKSPKGDDSTSVRTRRSKRTYSLAGLLVLVGIGLGGLCWLGLWGLDIRVRNDLDKAGAYQIPFNRVEVLSPRGMGREAFLTEVRFLSGSAETLSLLDRDLPARLSAAFRSHPWVAEVRTVTVSPAAGARVDLKFRDPVLRVADASAKAERLVDASGVLLPRLEGPRDWPLLDSVPERGPESPGKTWPSRIVEEGARLAGVMASGNLSGKVRALRKKETDWIVDTTRGEVRWGRSPGHEVAGEPSPAQKLVALTEWLSKEGAEPPDLTIRTP